MSTFPESEFPADREEISALMRATATEDEERWGYLTVLEGLVESGVPLPALKGLPFEDLNQLQWASASITGLENHVPKMSERALEVLRTQTRLRLPRLFHPQANEIRQDIPLLNQVSRDALRLLLSKAKPNATNGGRRTLDFSDAVLEEIEKTALASDSLGTFTIRPVVAVLGALIEKMNQGITAEAIYWRTAYHESGVPRTVDAIQSAGKATWQVQKLKGPAFVLSRK